MKASVHLMGGLGNQLFQIFAAMSYALQHGKKLLLPRNLFSGVGRRTYWGTFLKSCKPYIRNVINYPLYNEPRFAFDPLPFFDTNITLNGYFQSFKYFEVYYDEIIDRLQLRLQQEEMRKADLVGTTSLHFRLGDYKGSLKHPVIGNDYYERALKILKPQKVLCFCEEDVGDRIAALSDRFKDIEFKIIDSSIEDWKQLLLMSCCSDHIIANSTFSWWGAYFNGKEKRVCYPQTWFNPQHDEDTSDLFPSAWISIPK